jgi:hypothetical protein
MNGIPLADKLEEQGEQMPFGIAFELLSKPTLEFTDHELLLVANDLRAKRVKFLSGVADRPGATKRVTKPKPTDEEKAARTEHLRNQLKSSISGLEI